jgi:uncharacterized protein
MTTLQSINTFFEGREIGIAGVSRDPKKFGFQVYKFMKEHDYKVYPINPSADSILGDKCYAGIADLPETVKSLLILTKPQNTDKAVEDSVKKGIPNIWIQQMSQTKSAVETAKKNNVNVVTNKCIFMFTEPVGSVHKFHRFMIKLFGRYPK